MRTTGKYLLAAFIIASLLGMPARSDAGMIMWTAKLLGKTKNVAVESAAFIGRRGAGVWRSAKSAFWSAKYVRIVGGLTNAQIKQLARLSVPEAGKVLGALKLSTAVLEDTYLRILIQQGKISKTYAHELWTHLKNVDGFVATMRKATSANKALQMGHLYELGLAGAASKRGFEVVSIGKKFRDPAKKALTDMDLLLRKGRTLYMVEAKNYPDIPWDVLPMFRADMDSLRAFGKGKRYFIVSNKPSDPNVLKALMEAAEQRGVNLLFGKPEEVMSQII